MNRLACSVVAEAFASWVVVLALPPFCDWSTSPPRPAEAGWLWPADWPVRLALTTV
jgi:hypothetical protein